MNILVFEYAVGGGFKKEIDPWILAEGYAMFSTIASGFKKAGHIITGLVDNRFYALKFLDEQIKVEPGKHLEKLKNATKECDIDAVFVIAPESNSELYFASKIIEDNGIVLLGSSSEGIKTTSIKAHTYRILKNKVPLPPTKITTFKLTEAKLAVKEVGGYPVVVKSVDGVACSGLSFVKNDAQLLQALIKTNKISKFQYCLVQKYLEGIHASVSLICNGHSAFPLSLNQQFIKLNLPEAESKYFG
ncbi:MAG: ATP-grasp domain-containing protein, partial [Euryarchaeota archaeon]|nr:ATP-grasp domain-containing protein [Euryarchaeota archaeon]